MEVVGDKPQKLEWPGYGFYIEVPDGALPPGVTAHVAVKVILAGQFELPEDSQLISAIYWVSSSEVFIKEVAVNIQFNTVQISLVKSNALSSSLLSQDVPRMCFHTSSRKKMACLICTPSTPPLK